MIYLDNAATTFPKPPTVSTEVQKCMTEYCGNPGRSGHILSLRAAEKIFACREAIASFFGSSKPENVVFTLNTTYAINLAIEAYFERGSHVLFSNLEHNSVFRPILKKCEEENGSFSIFNALLPTPLLLREIESKICPNTKMLIMLHTSNVCGKTLPLFEIGRLCKARNILFIVDAAQSAGKLPIDIEKNCIDAVCAPAHKGLYGPQGLGFVLFGNKPPIRNFITGGNGVNSLSAEMGLSFPESFEGGTLPTPAIAGLYAALQWLNTVGISNIQQKEMRLARALKERLSALPDSIFFGAEYADNGILLYKNARIHPDKLASDLNEQHICTRSGFHCSPLAHAALSTGEAGALRISFGYFNSSRDVDGIYHAIASICK